MMDWSALRCEIETSLRQLDALPDSVRVDGKVVRLGAGLSHENYLFHLTADEPLPHRSRNAYVLRRCLRDGGATSFTQGLARLEREARTLQALASQKPGFAAPAFICFTCDPPGRHDGLIETALSGMRLDEFDKLTDKRHFAVDIIARVAGAVHRMPGDRFAFLERFADARAHVQARLDACSLEHCADDPDVRHAVQWITAHARGVRPPVVLHGDLLPQNILWDWHEQRAGVIDWEYAQIGDPAYDLAIVTRGNAKLCGLSNGVARLVNAYRGAGGAPILVTDVVVHELLLLLNWLSEALQQERCGDPGGHPPDQYRRQIRSVLRRAASLREG